MISEVRAIRSKADLIAAIMPVGRPVGPIDRQPLAQVFDRDLPVLDSSAKSETWEVVSNCV